VFFLITFLLGFGAIFLTWTPLAKNAVGITDILPCLYKTAAQTLAGPGLSIFAFAFFLYAILQSQAFQALFASKRKWLEKRKYFTIGLITLVVALLSANLSWLDELVFFYPLVIPLLLALGFDTFSAVLCLYGGSIAGLMGLISTRRWQTHFEQSFGSVKGKINYYGLAGIGFGLVSFILFVSLIILFNIWYCNRNWNKVNDKKKNLVKPITPPPFSRRKKIILAVAGFFLLGSVLAQISPLANKLEKISPKTPAWISSEYSEREYQGIGNIGKEMKIAKVQERKVGYWGTFGNWKNRALDCWLIIGGVIICLLSQQKILKSLTISAQEAIPFILFYIFTDLLATIMINSGLSEGLAQRILPTTTAPFFKYWLLFSIFGLSLLFNFFVASVGIGTALVVAAAPTLLAISESTLIYAAIFAWMGAILGCAFSPFHGVLLISLKKVKLTYKQFIKKTWKLGLIMLVMTFGLIWFWIKFRIK
jgi:uncharacterized ion transporter superfamily protein YfcC